VERDLDDSLAASDRLEVDAHAEEAPQAPAVPKRPADSAKRDEWVGYCVALGASESYLTAATQHWNNATEEYDEHPALTVAELRELADSLGG